LKVLTNLTCFQAVFKLPWHGVGCIVNRLGNWMVSLIFRMRRRLLPSFLDIFLIDISENANDKQDFGTFFETNSYKDPIIFFLG
jgi:hypothetical protein